MHLGAPNGLVSKRGTAGHNAKCQPNSPKLPVALVLHSKYMLQPC